MPDWVSEMSPEEKEAWDDFVKHTRESTMESMFESSMVMSLVPTSEDKVDVKFAVELGMAIMMNKPIVAVAQPGTPIPPKLRQIADRIIELSDDLDTSEGRDELAKVLREIVDHGV